MNLVLGLANPALQKVLLELCFSDEKANPDFSQPRLLMVDDALRQDVLSGEQLRVLPLLYRLSTLAGMSRDSVTKIVGIYKHTYCRNNLMLHRLARVQQAFNAAGFGSDVESGSDSGGGSLIGLKGLPAIAYLDQGIGARPMADVDVLIANVHKRPEQALSILTGLGYRVKNSGIRSLTLTSAERLELDLHWYVQDWALGQDLVDHIGAHATSHKFGLQSFRIPCVEHHLAHTIAHGAFSNTLTYDARWVFDAVGVLKRVKPLDVDLFAQFANRVAAPELIKSALSALVIDLPEQVQIDRDQLQRINRAVKTNAKITSWLYRQTPRPNSDETTVVGMSRVDRFKTRVICHVWLPRYLNRRVGLSWLGYWRWVDHFPPLTRQQAIRQIFNKVFVRGPLFLYQFVAQKRV